MLVRSEVAVLGSGPAGLALAAACAERGLDVVCVAPSPWRAWSQNFGLWSHQASLVPEDAVAGRYASPKVWLHDEAGFALPRAYLRLSTFRLHRALVARAEQAGVRFVDARVDAIEHGEVESRLRTDAAITVAAALAVDASGASTRHLARSGETVDAHQTAYGIVAEVAEHPYAPGEMSFMDFRHDPNGEPHAAPSFLYSLPLDDRHVFLEETALVQKPAMPIDALRARLHERLRAMRIDVVRVHEEERCVIPMGLGLPSKEQPLLGFGAAAAMVHPATGYQLASALKLAPSVARAIHDGLESGGPSEARRLGWEAVWPAERARLWSLYRFGMAALCSFDLERTRIFFESFFALEERDWQRYLDATASPTELAAIMGRLFCGAPLATQWRLLWHGVGSGRAELWRATRLGGFA